MQSREPTPWMLAAGPLVALWCAGCSAVSPMPPPRRVVEVEQVGTRFPAAGRGELHLVLQVENRDWQPAKLSALSWELWLQGRWFAAGSQALTGTIAPGASRRLELDLPVVFRHYAVRSEPTGLDVSVRGELVAQLGLEERSLAFDATRRVVSEGSPVLNHAGDD